MLNVKPLILIVASAVLALNCGTSAKSQQLKDGNGKVIGRYDVLSDSEAKANFDVNQNGVYERVASYKDQKLVAVEYFDDANGTKTKAVRFKDGKPESVTVFDKNGKEVRGDVAYDAEKNAAKEVTLPAKKKKVIFNGDGTVSVVTIENK
jgi:antitoxin component YwqK of YwqJK toxin-antitoxin module